MNPYNQLCLELSVFQIDIHIQVTFLPKLNLKLKPREAMDKMFDNDDGSMWLAGIK